MTLETVKKAIELGVNYFDTAEGYGAGEAEKDLGIAFKELKVNREDIVVSTKVFMGFVGGANSVGTSKKRIHEALKASLKRLQLDYVDIVFCHRFDRDTPLEEVCRAMNTEIENGRAFYWGTSEWTAAQIASAIEICAKLNLHRPIVEQP